MEGNKKIFKNDVPVYDLVVCAAKNLAVRNTELLGSSFKIVNSSLSKETVDAIQTDIENTYKNYSRWFGEIHADNMCLVISKRDKGGGYSRIGALFLGGLTDSAYLKDRIDILQYVSHEAAHFWWNGAPCNWEDWLNESFAEYSAMKIIKILHGEEEFRVRLNIKIDESKDTPPVWGIERNDPKAEQVLYGKGVVLLSELEERIGDIKFEEMCKGRIKNSINSTTCLLELVNDIAGIETAGWFEQCLMNR